MIVKIVCAGDDSFSKLYQKEEGEFLLGVDSGCLSIIAAGGYPDLAIGDFDSIDIQKIIPFSKIIKIFPENKDYSDLELAIREIENYRAQKIHIYNVTGGRLDHFFAALNVLIRYSHLNLEILDERNRFRIISGKTEVFRSKYRYLSFFAIDDDTHISLSGFKYDLDNYHLERTDNLCLSNEVINHGIIITDKKVLIVETL
jgi:thiamine pyrophosphokinase